MVLAAKILTRGGVWQRCVGASVLDLPEDVESIQSHRSSDGRVWCKVHMVAARASDAGVGDLSPESAQANGPTLQVAFRFALLRARHNRANRHAKNYEFRERRNARMEKRAQRDLRRDLYGSHNPRSTAGLTDRDMVWSWPDGMFRKRLTFPADDPKGARTVCDPDALRAVIESSPEHYP